jgi:hypothetical protein
MEGGNVPLAREELLAGRGVDGLDVSRRPPLTTNKILPSRLRRWTANCGAADTSTDNGDCFSWVSTAQRVNVWTVLIRSVVIAA